MTIIETDESWAVSEFAAAELGDERRRQRLIEIATGLGHQPTASLPQACGSRAMLKAVIGSSTMRRLTPTRFWPVMSRQPAIESPISRWC